MRKAQAGVKTLRDQHAESTRRTLVALAVQQFGERGYAGTSLEDVARAAGATKGAVYHHFKDKKELFTAAYQAMNELLVERIRQRAGKGGALSVDQAITAFLEETTDPLMLRVLLQEGPAVLGCSGCREIDRRYGLGLLTDLTKASVDPKLLRDVGAELMAKLLLAVVIEASHSLGEATDRKGEQRRVEKLLRRLFEGLRAPS